MANSHSMHLMKPRGSFKTRVSMTVLPIGWKTGNDMISILSLLKDLRIGKNANASLFKS